MTRHPPGQVPLRQAARELGIGVVTLRELMESKQINVGYCTERGRQRHFVVFRKLLDDEKERIYGFRWERM